jgi:ribosome-binding protein aMBF1 (putative translation factor)
VLTLPEICELCRREVEALERVIVLSTREEKRVAAVSFRESVQGVRCMDCSPPLPRKSGPRRSRQKYECYNRPVPLLQNLKRVREERRMSVRRLSARSGVSADSISDFEELRRMASDRTAEKLADALGVAPSELVGD